MTSQKDTRTEPQYKLRMPTELKEYLAQKAKENKRSLNAEIVERLEMTEYQDDQHSNGFYFLLQDFQELKKGYERLQDEFDEFKYQSSPKNASIQTSIDELREKIDEMMRRSNP